MFGISSPVSAFHNRRAAPDRLSAAELKTEIISRTSNDPNIHPRFATIAQMACTNTAYIHMVRKVEAIKPWATQNVTLLGDSVFNMSNMLGKGANCALLDAVSLAETLTSQTYSRRSPIRLQKYVTENIERRMRERHRSALMQKLVFYGDNKVKGFLRDKALPYTLKRIDGLDQENHSQMANGTFADWVADDEAWQDRSQVWAEELRWDEIYDEEHGHGGMVLKPPTPTSQCHACGSCGSVVSPSVASSVIGDRSLRRSGSIGAPSSIYSQASTMSPNYAADEATRVHPLGMNYYGASHAKPHMAQHPHMLPKVAAAMRGDVEPRALAESRASYATTMVDQQSLGYASRRTSMSQNSSAGSVGSACTTTNGVGNGHYIPPFCAQHGPGGCPTVQVVTSTCCPGHAIGAIPEKSEKRNAIHSEADLKCGGRVETVTVAPNEIL